MIFKQLSTQPEGDGRVAKNLRDLRRLVKRLTPTGPGVSHGPVGTSYRSRLGRKSGDTTDSVPRWG